MELKSSCFVNTALWDSDTARDIDRRSSEEFHLPALVLMEHAGKGLASFISATYPEHHVVILAGPGNNGGDGLVAARWLFETMQPVQIIHVSQRQPAQFSALCSGQIKVATALGIEQMPYSPGCLENIAKNTGPPLLIVDAILGNGYKGELRDGPILDALQEAARLDNKSTLAVDCPSGLGIDYHAAAAPPLTADYTLTFGNPKPAHIHCLTREYCGSIRVVDCGFPKAAIAAAEAEAKGLIELANPESWLKPTLESRIDSNSHKFTRGHILVIGGSKGKLGAPLLTGLAAFKSGAGWVSLALPPGCQKPIDLAKASELQMTEEDLYQEGKLSAEKIFAFAAKRKVQAIIIGPGWHQNHLDTSHLKVFRQLQSDLGIFILFDAGATGSLGPLLEAEPLNPQLTAMTPHPGEWRRIAAGLPKTLNDQADCLKTMQKAESWGVCLVHKSATPLVFCSHSHKTICLNHGTNALGKAGSGDMLAGIAAVHAIRGFTAGAAVVRAQIVLAQAARSATSGRQNCLPLAEEILDHLSFWL